MRKSSLVGGLAAALASMVLVLPPPAAAAPPDGSGDVYSDLFIALRDVDGVPILSETFHEEGGIDVQCIQPISYVTVPGIDPSDTVTNEADGREVYLIPLVGETSIDGPPVLADTACDPQTAFLPYVSEVDLERLNLVRTSPEVLWKKLDEVRTRLLAATKISLDGAGRITTWSDDVATAIDASPDQAAIYAAAAGDPVVTPAAEGGPAATPQRGGLMDTGSIPGLPSYPLDAALDEAFIQQGEEVDEGFDNWMLAASAIGTATGKSVPVNIDTVEYYNRTAAPDGEVGSWEYTSEGFLLDRTVDSYQFVDYRDFSYTRSDVFEGCTTWLDVPSLTWKYDSIVNRVEFIDIVDFEAQPVPGTVTNVAGFAQMADDVRSVINYLHENEVVVDPVTGEGFFIDPVFTETCEEQAETVVRLNTPVDAVDPTVTITAAPTAMTTATTATFEFTATDAASVLCVLDSGAIERCLSPKTYTGLEPGTHTFNVIAMGVAGNFASDTHTWTIIRPGEDSMITSLTPVRFADTRPGWIAADGLFYGTGPVPAGRVVQVQIAGRGDVPFGAKAVVANVTVVGATIPGFATVFPCGTLPGTSSVNYLAGEAVANEVIAKLSPTGSICVYVHSAVNVIVDVAGYL